MRNSTSRQISRRRSGKQIRLPELPLAIQSDGETTSWICTGSLVPTTDINFIENFQRWATKQLPGMAHLPYPERLKKLDPQTLLYHRLRGDMIEVYKQLHGKYAPRCPKDQLLDCTLWITRWIRPPVRPDLDAPDGLHQIPLNHLVPVNASQTQFKTLQKPLICC